MGNVRQLALVEQFLEETKPTSIEHYDVVFKGLNMKSYLIKFIKKMRTKKCIMASLFRKNASFMEFVSQHEQKMSIPKDQTRTVYIGLHEYAAQTLTELKMQVTSLQVALRYAQERQKNPDTNILSTFRF